jgi:hypothetical protein
MEYRALKYLSEIEEQPISTVMKKLAVDKAENDYYYRQAVKALREHQKCGKTYTIDEVIKHIKA